jgi:hypothetical protein
MWEKEIEAPERNSMFTTLCQSVMMISRILLHLSLSHIDNISYDVLQCIVYVG